jgi:hypothetical protein
LGRCARPIDLFAGFIPRPPVNGESETTRSRCQWLLVTLRGIRSCVQNTVHNC